jgi:AraC-like DNA-binding protein
MADGCAEMVFHYKGSFDEITNGKSESSFKSGLHGPSKNYRRFITENSFGIFGVYFYPFALPQLFSMPACELSDQLPDLKALLGNKGAALEEKIMLADNNRERVHIMSSFLQKKITDRNDARLKAIKYIINQIIHSGGLVPVNELASQSFLSVRQFERNFKIFSGFSPKLYSRIVRFQMTTQQYGNNNKSLTDIAYDCGYYDQSHFIHDFKQFSGYHPKQYFFGDAEGVQWKEASN